MAALKNHQSENNPRNKRLHGTDELGLLSSEGQQVETTVSTCLQLMASWDRSLSEFDQ